MREGLFTSPSFLNLLKGENMITVTIEDRETNPEKKRFAQTFRIETDDLIDENMMVFVLADMIMSMVKRIEEAKRGKADSNK
jgi:RPA family protein